MSATATGVLLAWKRLDNLRPIIGGMLDAGMREIIVWSNRSHATTDKLRLSIAEWFPHRNVTVLGQGTNIYTLGRYKAAVTASDSLIATCDDDCVVDNWADLLLCCDGTDKLVANIHPGHYDCYVRNGGWEHPFEGGIAYEALVGWGAVFPKRLAYRLDAYVNQFGTDELLRRKADRFFTMLQAKPHVLFEHAVENLPGATDDSALYHMPDHWALNRQAQDRAIAILEMEHRHGCRAARTES